MQKVKNIYIADQRELENYATTGLVLELEDGSFLAQSSTDPIVPFSEAKFVPGIVHFPQV